METGRLELATARQQAYYERTALHYDADHVQAGDEHSIALNYIAQLARVVGARSVLDVGAGTGRGLRYLADLRPDLDVVGVEPVEALRMQAELSGTSLVEGNGDELKFDNDAFDLVIATGVLHHVAHPHRVVSEMMRVARLGVMISDTNRFGHGRHILRAAKFAMHSTGLWRPYMWMRTRGRGYLESEGDGIFYSYSVFDSMPTLNEWSDRCFVIPTKGCARGRFGAFADASHGLLVGLREPAGTLKA